MAIQTKTFSVGDFTKGGSTNGYILDLIVTEEAVDLAANTSQLSYTLQLRSGGSNRFTSSYFWCSVSINGQEKTANPGITAAYYHTYTLLSGSLTVAHDPDGSYSLPFSASMWNSASNTYAPYDATLTGQLALTPIPRANTIKATDADIGSVSMLSILPASSEFTHTVAYQFGALTGYINEQGEAVEQPTPMTAVSIPFTLPQSFYDQIPDAPWGSCTLTCVTYQQDVQIGQAQTCSFRASANKELCAPELCVTVVDVNPVTLALTGDEKVLIRYGSTAQCTLQAQAKNGARIVEKTLAGQPVTEDTLLLSPVQTGQLSGYAADSRGYTQAAYDAQVRLVEYTPPTNLASISRDDPTSGNATVCLSGSCWEGSFGAAENELFISYSIDGAEPVTAQPTLTVSQGRYTGSLQLTGLTHTAAHQVALTVSDRLNQVTKLLSVQKGVPVFDWGESDFCFHVPVQSPALNGVRMAAAQAWGSNAIRLQTGFTAMGEGNSRQSILLFGRCNAGYPVQGLICITDNGATTWQGSEGVSLSAMDTQGQITVNLPTTAYDRFVLLSAYDFSVL